MKKQYFKAILDNSPESIVLIGKNHEVLSFNRTIKEVLQKYFKREIKEGDFYYPDFVVESSRELYMRGFNSAIEGKTFLVHDHTENNNISLWFEYITTPIYDEYGSLLGISLSAKDITERRKLEISLQESEARFRNITALAPIGIIITDNEFNITYANLAAGKMLGYEVDTLNNLLITDIVTSFTLSSQNKIRVDELDVDIETPIFQHENFQAITKNNRKIEILLSSVSFYSQGNLSFIFIIQDITDIKLKEKLIDEQTTKLKDIAWYQSHIIRAPLARIMGIITLFEDKSFENGFDKKEKDYLFKAMLDSAYELDKVINRIVEQANNNARY